MQTTGLHQQQLSCNLVVDLFDKLCSSACTKMQYTSVLIALAGLLASAWTSALPQDENENLVAAVRMPVVFQSASTVVITTTTVTSTVATTCAKVRVSVFHLMQNYVLGAD